jgi:hypothetical protein
MSRPTLDEARREMAASEFHDFCVNQSIRLARYAAKLYDAGSTARAKEMREIADRLGALATAQEAPAA